MKQSQQTKDTQTNPTLAHPKPNGVDSLTYKLTPAQRESVEEVYGQLDKINLQLGTLLNHFVREADLPKLPTGYRLSEDRTMLVPNEKATA